MYFQSQDGTMDSASITQITIDNSRNPICWNYYTTGNGEYEATAIVYFTLRGKKKDMHHFYLYREYGDDLLCFGARLFNKWTPSTHKTDTCMLINGLVLDDIVFFEEKNMDTFQNMEQPPVPITSIAWSKQYGLVQYTFQDGTVFNRIDLQ